MNPNFSIMLRKKKLEPLNFFLATMRLTGDDKIYEEQPN